MKTLFVIGFALASSICFAGEGSPCEKIEYARLKDSTRPELVSEYCVAVAKDELNQALGKIQKDRFDATMSSSAQRAMSEIGDARVTCVRAAEEAARMLQQKFKAARPKCPKG